MFRCLNMYSLKFICAFIFLKNYSCFSAIPGIQIFFFFFFIFNHMGYSGSLSARTHAVHTHVVSVLIVILSTGI